MDMSKLKKICGVESAGREVVGKAAELLRICNMKVDSAAFGVGEIAKSVICFHLACFTLKVQVDRKLAVNASGLSEKAYLRSYTALQHLLGVKSQVDMRTLGVKFGCVRLVDSASSTLSLYRKRFIAGLPEARQGSADFSRPVFPIVAFYLTARHRKLKVDSSVLISTYGVSEEEFNSIRSSMSELCFDVIGVGKRKADVEKGPEDGINKRVKVDEEGSRHEGVDEEDEELSNEELTSGDEEEVVVPGLKRTKVEKKRKYDDWKKSVLEAKNAIATIAGEASSKLKQAPLSFSKS